MLKTIKGCLGLAIVCSATLSMAAKAEESAVQIDDKSFNCLYDMTPVRGFFVDNLLGDLEATVAVAESSDGGKYPAGSVVQLLPGEVMVKHPEGTHPSTNDWEFVELEVSADGAKIVKRGFEEINNKFGLNCFDCHVKAEPKWDLVCETGHGCDPLPLTRTMIDVIQKTDPRCEPQPLTDEEKAAGLQLKQMFGK